MVSTYLRITRYNRYLHLHKAMPRRKGKQSNGRNTPVASSDATKQDPPEDVKVDPKPSSLPSNPKPTDELVLPSEKRRGVYECDYCHSDISQLPRIRCAVCADFDLCLDCFANTDHSAAIARMKAAATTHSELAADGIASTMVTGLSFTNHDDTHGYRVCDSIRYPISGSARNVIKLSSPPPSATDDDDDDSNQVDKAEYRMILHDDQKTIWTAEEDLRLLDAIATHGLGNWIDIADAIGGNGSAEKTPKRCMERYFDCFLGRYGHVLPEFTIVEENPNDEETNTAARKRFKVVPTESLKGYKEWWPEPYLPDVEAVEMGQEVARDLSQKNELEFVKITSAASTQEEVQRIRKEWEERCLNQKIGAPTVLPPRPEDSDSLPGAELVGFMPRRGDFDIEHENEAEVAIAEMEFLETDTEQEKQLKIKVLQIYYEKQNEREKRKQFILSRKLYDYREYVKNEQELPRDERDLRHRMRLFERFHTPEEHKQFIDDIIKAKRLRKEIAKLQMYRRIGIRSLAEAEKYELDKSRRQFHKAAQLQREALAKQPATASSSSILAGSSSTPAASQTPGIPGAATFEVSESLWKNYRTSDRKGRRSINRANSGVSSKSDGEARGAASPTPKEDPLVVTPKTSDIPIPDAMEVDADDSKTEAPNSADKASSSDGATIPIEEADDDDTFDISSSSGYDLLSSREVELCLVLRIYPQQYLEIKKALIQVSFNKGLLENEGPGSYRRTVVNIDVKRRGEIIDFFLRSGWIRTELAGIARTVTPPLPTPRNE